MVGDNMHRGISGGQKKRVTTGMELNLCYCDHYVAGIALEVVVVLWLELLPCCR